MCALIVNFTFFQLIIIISTMTALHVLIALMLVIPLIAVTYAADAREGGGGGREPWSSLSEEVEVWSQPAASGNAKWQRHETLTEVAAMLRGRGLRRSSTGDDDDDHRHHTAKKIWPLQLSVEEEEDPPHPFGGRDIGSAEFRANVARRQMESCNRECGINPPPPAGIERRVGSIVHTPTYIILYYIPNFMCSNWYKKKLKNLFRQEKQNSVL